MKNTKKSLKILRWILSVGTAAAFFVMAISTRIKSRKKSYYYWKSMNKDERF